MDVVIILGRAFDGLISGNSLLEIEMNVNTSHSLSGRQRNVGAYQYNEHDIKATGNNPRDDRSTGF